MKNLGALMRQAQEMQERMAELQAKWEATEVEGFSGGGMVRVVMNGKGTLRKLTIEPSLLVPEEAQIVEDLIIAACAEAKGKAEALMQAEMAKLTGGLPLPPGFKLPF